MSSVFLNRRALLALVTGSPIVACCSAAFAGEPSIDQDGTPAGGPFVADGNIQLQTIGGLGVGHIQSTLGLIGVLADSVSKSIYTTKQIEDLMTGTINGLELPKRMLRRLQDSSISGDDSEFLDRMISVFNALQREARALIVYSKSRTPDDATLFEKTRRSVLKKLGELTLQDELMNTPSASREGNVPLPLKGAEQTN